MNDVLLESNFQEVPLLARGKVRDLYDLGESILIVSSDRISAFDYVLPAGIPGKGRVLTQLSAFWFGLTESVAKNHLLSTALEDLPPVLAGRSETLAGRFMLVKKVEVFPVECVVRGYMAGSGWKEYLRSGTICGLRLPEGLRESDKLSEPIFTPTTKAESGHDMPITYAELENTVGVSAARTLQDRSIELYGLAAGYAEAKSILIADTKLEWGVFNGDIVLADEAFTPDSSRFWPRDDYEPGRSQASFDKQYVRDYLESIGWDKTPPVPSLPIDVVQKTAEKYRMALELLTGQS